MSVTFVTTGTQLYAPGLLLLARSLRKHMPAADLLIVKPSADPLSDRSKRALQETGARFHRVDFAKIRRSIEPWLVDQSTIYGPETFLKLWLPGELGTEFWWIDSDVVVLDVLSDLSAEHSDAPCSLAWHPLPLVTCFDMSRPGVQALLVRHSGQRFDLSHSSSLNGGLAYFNTARFIESGLFDASVLAIAELRGALTRADESLLNLFRWRFQLGTLDNRLQQFISPSDVFRSDDYSLSTAASIHFTGFPKPWMQSYPDSWAKQLYRQGATELMAG